MTLGFGAKTDRESHNIYSQSAGGTGTYLGPGAYNSDRYGTIQPKKSGKAPFSSTATRNSNAEKKNSQAPGPGNYMIEQSLGSPNVPASSFHSTTERFHQNSSAHQAAEAPGPGAYTVPDTFGHKGGGRFRPRQGGRDPSLMWMRVPTAPSIPTKLQSYGYEEGGDHGELVMQRPAAAAGHTGLKGDLAGPGAYDVLKDSFTRKKAPVMDFSKGSRRPDVLKMTLAAPSNPGPGEYELLRPLGADSPGLAAALPEGAGGGGGGSGGGGARGAAKSSVFRSTTQRVGRPRPKDLTPGPGDYEVVSADVALSRMYQAKEQSFGSTVARFEAEGPRARARRHAGPGPGAYEVAARKRGPRGRRRGSGPGPRAQDGTSGGFNSTAVRLQSLSQQDMGAGAGPGAYHQPGMAEAVQKKLASRAGAFGSTQRRFVRNDAKEEGPAVGDYNLGIGEEARMSQTAPPAGGGGAGAPSRSEAAAAARARAARAAPSSMFASADARFRQLRAERARLEGPAPGEYQRPADWSKRSGVLPLGKGPQRFRDAKPAYEGGLGPGSYELRPRRLAAPRGTGNPNVMAKAPARFQAPKPTTQVPGPGQYRDDHRTSLIKRTFNIAVAENCARL